MSKEQINSELKDLGSSINEVLSSTAAVKGDAFARAVAINFECAQLVEAIAGLVIMARKDDEEYANALFEVTKTILASVAIKACDEMPDEQFDEAMKMSRTLHDRRLRTIEKIQKEIDNDD